MKQLTFKRCLMLSLIISCFLIPFKVSSQWVEQNSNSDLWLTSVYFINENTGFIGSSEPLPLSGNFYGGEIIRTTNGGTNWSRVLLDSNLRVKSFYFTDQNTGYAIGGSFATTGYLFKTTDGGLTWQDNLNSYFYQHFYNMYFGDQLTGYLSSFNGLYKTTNAGANWNLTLTTTISNVEYQSHRRLFFFDVNTGFFLTDSGNIFKTTNQGIDWGVSYVSPEFTFRDITFINVNTGYIVGLNGVFLKTTNQGSNWNSVNIGTTSSFYSIKFANALVGYMSKENGVLKTTDGGNTWQEVLQQGSDTLFSTFFLNPEVGYVGGTNGKVFKTITGGVIGMNQISTEIPNAYSLEQNYPNPFNPATNIKFAIPKLANVRLAIYDLLGREVESLVNQQLTPGIYEVNWNASKFSSGIYMYRLVTNDFSMVKKMSLIK
jgi:photosystem II stability/assembly factor-like uncharacterized protein